MFTAYSFLVYLCIFQFSPLVKSLPTQQPNSPSKLQAQNSTACASSALKGSLVTATSDHKVFPLPHGSLVLDLQPNSGISPGLVESILLIAGSWIAGKISILGPATPSDYIWEYGTGRKSCTRLITWSFGNTFTWGRVGNIVDGLWLFLIDLFNEKHTSGETYIGDVLKESQIGSGPIIDADSLLRKSSIRVTPSSPTSKRAIQISSEIGLPTSNISQSLLA